MKINVFELTNDLKSMAEKIAWGYGRVIFPPSKNLQRLSREDIIEIVNLFNKMGDIISNYKLTKGPGGLK